MLELNKIIKKLIFCNCTIIYYVITYQYERSKILFNLAIKFQGITTTAVGTYNLNGELDQTTKYYVCLKNRLGMCGYPNFRIPDPQVGLFLGSGRFSCIPEKLQRSQVQF